MVIEYKRILFVSVCSGFILGRIPVYLSPWLLGEFIDELGYSGSKAGAIISFELIGVAVAAFILSLLIKTTSTRFLATAGALIACVAHILSLFTTEFAILAVVRFFAGFGVGLAIASCAAIVAQLSEPEKTYGHVHSVLAIASTLTLYTTGYIIGIGSYSWLFLMMALLCAISTPFLRQLPISTINHHTSEDNDKKSFILSGIIITLAVFLFSIADIATWAFIERIANRIQLSSEDTGLILGTGALLSVSGALVASVIGLRFGRQIPLIIGLSVAAISIIGLYQCQTGIGFSIMYFWFSASWFFSLPFMLGIAAALDIRGSWAASATSAMYWGMAFAPAIFGLVYDTFGLNTVGHFSSTLILLALIMFLFVTHQLNIKNIAEIDQI